MIKQSPDTITDSAIKLPEAVMKALRTDNRAYDQFFTLPPAIQENIATLCTNIAAENEQRRKHPFIAQIADIIGEYFDGYGKIFECLTGHNFFNFKQNIVEKSEGSLTIRTLTEGEKNAAQRLSDAILNAEGEMREKYIVAYCRLAHKSGALNNLLQQKRNEWGIDDEKWHKLRKKYIGMTTQELVPELFILAEAASTSVTRGRIRADTDDVTSAATALFVRDDVTLQDEDGVMEDASLKEEKGKKEVVIPAAIQAELEVLYNAYDEAGGKKNQILVEVQKVAVEIYRLSKEYDSWKVFQSIGIKKNTLQSYADTLGIAMLDLTEAHVLTALESSMQRFDTPAPEQREKANKRDTVPMTAHTIATYHQRRNDYSPDEKRMMMAAFRLMRKKLSHSEALRWWEESGFSCLTWHKWHVKLAEMPTRELVKPLYQKAEAELGIQAPEHAEAGEPRDRTSQDANPVVLMDVAQPDGGESKVHSSSVETTIADGSPAMQPTSYQQNIEPSFPLAVTNSHTVATELLRRYDALPKEQQTAEVLTAVANAYRESIATLMTRHLHSEGVAGDAVTFQTPDGGIVHIPYGTSATLVIVDGKSPRVVEPV